MNQRAISKSYFESKYATNTTDSLWRKKCIYTWNTSEITHLKESACVSIIAMHVGFTFHCRQTKVSIHLAHLLCSVSLTMGFWNLLIKRLGLFPLKLLRHRQHDVHYVGQLNSVCLLSPSTPEVNWRLNQTHCLQTVNHLSRRCGRRNRVCLLHLKHLPVCLQSLFSWGSRLRP